MSASSALRRRAAQLARYATTSVVATGTSLLILTALVAGGVMRPAPANVVATLAGIVPSFEMNRRWVWGVTGRPSVRRQILPFVALSLTGLVLSTLAVGAAGAVAERAGWGRGETAVVSIVANLAAFGTVWIAQFVILDRRLFKQAVAGLDDADEVPALVR